jgi:hypothetical protein
MISVKNIEKIVHNTTLCASIRKLWMSGAHSVETLGNELKRGAAKRGVAMTQAEAVALIDAIVGDA